ncbi:hypothetical protein [Terribacillus saccharophilus]|uniref:hypothetical protein n=1 Tax=Terribacillus saccharophilus TaxID=361277 RepID=UPI0039824DEE
MTDINIKELEKFLQAHPQMSLAPSNKEAFIVQGVLSFDIQDDSYGNIKDEFQLKVVIPKSFPRDIPIVYELDERFPKIADYHVYADSSLCLGSPMSLKKRIKDNPTLEDFIQTCVVPYFFAIALKLQGKDNFVFGELYHGTLGIIQDYLEVFDLNNVQQVIDLLEILSLKSNKGNKNICPCGCNRIVTKCPLHKKIVEYRNVMSRKEYAEEREIITKYYNEWKEYQSKNATKKLIPSV